MGHAPGTLDEKPRRPTGLVASDEAAGGIGGPRADLQGVEPSRIRHCLVHAEVGHDDGPVEPEIIEVVAAEREVAAGAPTEASDPVRVRLSARLLDQRGAYRGGVLRLRETRTPRLEGSQREVVVSVDEA